MSAGPNTKWTQTGPVALTNAAQDIRLGATQMFGWVLHNPNGTDAWIQFFNLPAASVNLGVTAPDYTLKVPTTGEAVLYFDGPNGVYFNSNLSFAATTTETGNGALASPVSANIAFQ